MLNLALIGAGSWGIQYIKALEKIRGCRLKYICSPHIHQDKKLQDSYLTTDDYRKIANYKDINGIIIATPSQTHYRISSFFLKLGHNLLIEKPLTTSYQDAIRLNSLHERKRSVVQVGHIYQYHPGLIAMKKKINVIGKLIYIDTVAGKYYPEAYTKNLSALWEWGPHEISICSELLQDFPIAVSAWKVGRSEKDEMVYIRLIYDNQIQAYIKIGWLLTAKTKVVTLCGQKGILTFDEQQKKGITYYDTNTSKNYLYHFASKYSPLELQIKKFVRSIRKQENPRTDMSLGVQTVKVLHFAEKSLRKNGKLIIIDSR